MPTDVMASVGRNLASFGTGRLRENFPGKLKVWLVLRFCQPTAPMVADPSVGPYYRIRNQLITQNSRLPRVGYPCPSLATHRCDVVAAAACITLAHANLA